MAYLNNLIGSLISVDHFKEILMYDCEVHKSMAVEVYITAPPIGINPSAWSHISFNYWKQRLLFPIVDRKYQQPVGHSFNEP